MAIKIIPKLVQVTPKEMYSRIVSSTYDNIRNSNKGLAYIPSQFGGIFGQEYIQAQSMVMELTDFEVV